MFIEISEMGLKIISPLLKTIILRLYIELLSIPNAIRACAVSTVTADRTGKFVLLTYSRTASHCSTEAHLPGVPFPLSFDSRLVLRQS